MTAEALVDEILESPVLKSLGGTGFADLDQLTGGLRPGQLWLLVGEPGQGRTTLALQWALTLANEGHPVQVVCPREPSRWVTARLLANHARLPLNQTSTGRVADDHRERHTHACADLAGLPIAVFAAPGNTFTPEADPCTHHPAAVVLDDADLTSGLTPSVAAGYTAAGMLVVVTLPRDQVVLGVGDEAPLEPAWTRVSDVVLEVRHRGLLPYDPALSAPGEGSLGSTRPGEAELVVHRHRWGPTRTLPAAFLGHFAHFADMPRDDSP